MKSFLIATTALAGFVSVADGDLNNAKASVCGKLKAIAVKAGVNPAAYVGAFVAKCDSVGSTHKKSVSMANRLILGANKQQGRNT